MNSKGINLKCVKSIGKISKIILLLLFVILLADFITAKYVNSASYVEAMQMLSESKIVIIDAGHGGEDPGAIGISGVYEKDLNLEISYLIGAALAERGYAVIYTRSNDKLLYSDEENIKGLRKISDLKNRCKIAAEFPNALFVSIHMNSYKTEKYSGTQVYFKENDENSRMLAEKIQNHVKEKIQPQNTRKIKSGKDIYVLKNTENTSVLIECGFISNKDECKKLSEKEYQKRLSLSIVYGIIEYMEANQTEKEF